MSFNAPGYIKDFNYPGDTQGEYNGLYAAVTDNSSYDPNDPTSGIDYASILRNAPSMIRQGVDAINGIRNATTAVTAPTWQQQWLTASLPTKVMLGLVAFIALRWVVHDFR